MTNKSDLPLEEGAFLEFDKEMMLPKQLEDSFQVLEMGLSILAEDQDIIQVDHYKGIQVRVEHVIHGSLEGSRGSSKPKWHNKPFILPIPCGKS